jgi:hypothetical protein
MKVSNGRRERAQSRKEKFVTLEEWRKSVMQSAPRGSEENKKQQPSTAIKGLCRD